MGVAKTMTSLLAEIEQRRDLMSAAMESAHVDLALSTQSSAWMEYLTGVPRLQGRASEIEEPNLCALTPGEVPRFRLVHSNWKLESEARLAELGYPVVEQDDSVRAIRRLANKQPEAIWIDGDLPFAAAERVRAAFPSAVLQPFGDPAWAVRRRKSSYEIERLRTAAERTERVWHELAESLPARFTRWELLEEARARLTAAGSGLPAVPPNVYVLARNDCYEWGRPAGLAAQDEIEAPALLSIDGGIRLDGYCGDIGRTLALGEPPTEWHRSYDVAHEAQAAAIAALSVGAPVGAADAAARTVVEQAGLGPAFWIPSGHGIGLDVHEEPHVEAGEPTALTDGMVLSIEIGLWRRTGAGVIGDYCGFVEDLVVGVNDHLVRCTYSPATPIPIPG
jgi:Xaa-Pro aminopeptidase